MSDICFKDAEGFWLVVDSYQAPRDQSGGNDYCFVFTTEDTKYHQLSVGLSRDQAVNLAKFLIEELYK